MLDDSTLFWCNSSFIHSSLSGMKHLSWCSKALRGHGENALLKEEIPQWYNRQFEHVVYGVFWWHCKQPVLLITCNELWGKSTSKSGQFLSGQSPSSVRTSLKMSYFLCFRYIVQNEFILRAWQFTHWCVFLRKCFYYVCSQWLKLLIILVIIRILKLVTVYINPV